ncbi:hypothetical protein [Nesterenkonia sp. PF2B19]|uniref:hypothetical protein n=1 Tax=Nesterenkonia sp. PF2B19 TaxID=1881858 RepID=UPI00191C8A82|nr:hypothetical protein [Nesterenkonia sp. PF2B19]
MSSTSCLGGISVRAWNTPREPTTREPMASGAITAERSAQSGTLQPSPAASRTTTVRPFSMARTAARVCISPPTRWWSAPGPTKARMSSRSVIAMASPESMGRSSSAVRRPRPG